MAPSLQSGVLYQCMPRRRLVRCRPAIRDACLSRSKGEHEITTHFVLVLQRVQLHRHNGTAEHVAKQALGALGETPIPAVARGSASTRVLTSFDATRPMLQPAGATIRDDKRHKLRRANLAGSFHAGASNVFGKRSGWSTRTYPSRRPTRSEADVRQDPKRLLATSDGKQGIGQPSDVLHQRDTDASGIGAPPSRSDAEQSRDANPWHSFPAPPRRGPESAHHASRRTSAHRPNPPAPASTSSQAPPVRRLASAQLPPVTRRCPAHQSEPKVGWWFGSICCRLHTRAASGRRAR